MECTLSSLYVHQHGFIRGRSAMTNLKSLTQYFCESLDGRCQFDVLYTEFTKTFGTINHDLLSKLHAALYKLTTSYLYKRKGYVYNGYASKPIEILSGVPQGSNLRPLLVNIFIKLH